MVGFMGMVVAVSGFEGLDRSWGGLGLGWIVAQATAKADLCGMTNKRIGSSDDRGVGKIPPFARSGELVMGHPSGLGFS